MKFYPFLIIYFIFTLSGVFGQRKNYWLGKDLPVQIRGIKYDKVIAYDLKPTSKCKEFYVSKTKILDTSIVVEKKELSGSQIDSLEKFVFGSKEINFQKPIKPESTHLGILYYLDNKIVAFFTSHLEDDFFKVTVVDQKVETCKNCGWYFTMRYNQLNRKRINALCAGLNFGCCK